MLQSDIQTRVSDPDKIRSLFSFKEVIGDNISPIYFRDTLHVRSSFVCRVNDFFDNSSLSPDLIETMSRGGGVIWENYGFHSDIEENIKARNHYDDIKEIRLVLIFWFATNDLRMLFMLRHC